MAPVRNNGHYKGHGQSIEYQQSSTPRRQAPGLRYEAQERAKPYYDRGNNLPQKNQGKRPPRNHEGKQWKQPQHQQYEHNQSHNDGHRPQQTKKGYNASQRHKVEQSTGPPNAEHQANAHYRPSPTKHIRFNNYPPEDIHARRRREIQVDANATAPNPTGVERCVEQAAVNNVLENFAPPPNVNITSHKGASGGSMCRNLTAAERAEVVQDLFDCSRAMVDIVLEAMSKKERQPK